MHEVAETRVPPEFVWKAWDRAHALAENHGQMKAQGKFKYKIVDVKRGENFSIVWKTLFVRLVFTYGVRPLFSGSQISYGVEIKGPFAWFVRWMIQEKVRKDIKQVLKTMVDQLEGRG